MKFTHLPAFEKHLLSADPQHLSDVYLIVDSEEYTQRKWSRKLLQEGEEWKAYSSDQINASLLEELLDSYSMFSNRSCICITMVEKLTKPLLKKLINYLKMPHPQVRLVLGASSMIKDLALFAKEGVALDMSLEKPWDREKRLSDMIMKKLIKNKIRASTAICQQMVKMCGGSMALIDQETEKLVCYLYGKPEVQRKDLEFILSNPTQSIFKVGQALFDQHLQEALKIVSEQKFPLMMLIYSLRSSIQKSYRLKGVDRSDYTKAFPQLRGYVLEKALELSQKYSAPQFKRMLQILFEVELLMKSQPVAEDFLISYLLMKLRSVKDEPR